MNEKQMFTIKQIAERTAISTDTIRYYEKIELLPKAERKRNGHRIYSQKDLQMIELISCLKKTGMSLEQMRPFLAISNSDSLEQYPELMKQVQDHREKIAGQMASLQQILDFIDMKLEEGSFRKSFSNNHKNEEKSQKKVSLKSKHASSLEMSYFSEVRSSVLK
ncbi:MerR family transcriptional regulator [Aureibacillus halotolerans]|uniref:DNA-binding transcriptional MerR regulator n=1 Tax=Aureibacillus halotolerans TaxID=1508390 RepID=A0A4R6TXV9_9BACI|nr:MerR family transcriptional regulator [Aureibacillus halotolerans]TDQ38738.1 DNA-binding transcriptional MerR regulator [Aureibacillus halotolerans]